MQTNLNTNILSDQIISITDVRKNASKYLKTPTKVRYVVVNNKPTTVIQSVKDYEQTIEEIRELREKIRAQQEADYVKELHDYVNSDEYKNEEAVVFNNAEEFIEDLKKEM